MTNKANILLNDASKNKGQKVIVDEVLINPGFYGKLTGQWYDEKIWGVRLKGHIGHWTLKAFEETNTACR